MGKTRGTGNLIDTTSGTNTGDQDLTILTGPTLTLKNENTNTAIGRIGYDQTAKAITIGNGSTVDLITLGVWATWIPTLTGFTSAPTITAARYALIGKTCVVHFRMTASASNATTFTLTLPFAAANTATQVFVCCNITNNSAQPTSPGRIDTRVNSNIADCYIAANGGAWTAGSTNKGINFVITYEIA